jgi:bifunctional non-homologous end joining protein LigD
LALLVKDPPSGDGWFHELKYDGYRIGCRIDDKHVTLLSRNGKDWTRQFPELVDAAKKLKLRSALLDGEVTVVLPNGLTSFQALQNAFGAARRNLVYFTFDLLHLDGEDIASLPLEERKRRLQRLLARPGKDALIRYSDHVQGSGAEFFAAACRQHAEGIVCKRCDAPYTPGRGRSWLKVKCIKRQELVIGGFTDPEGSRQGLGALLVGYYDAAGSLRYAGKVGTGFTNRGAQELRRQLEGLEQRACEFRDRPAGKLGRIAHWVKPSLVAEVAFTEWTADGKIRHPSFQGLRADKAARAVIREEPSDTPNES